MRGQNIYNYLKYLNNLLRIYKQIQSLDRLTNQMMKVRKPGNGDPWDSLNSTEVIEADSLFEDDVVVSRNEATLSNTE